MKKKGTQLILTAWIIGVYFFGSACGSKNPPAAPAQSQSAPAAPAVDVVTVRSESMRETVDAVGTLEANERASIKPEIAGRIVRFSAEEGQAVRKGDILVELDPDKLKQDVEVASAKILNTRQGILQQREQLAVARARIEQARAGIEQARQIVREFLARLSRADSVLERAKQDEARTRTLYQKEFKTQDDLEKSVSAVKQAEADRNTVLASLSGAELSDLDRHPAVKQAQAALNAALAEEQAILASLGEAADRNMSVDMHPEVRRALAEINLAKEKLKDMTLLAPMDGVLSTRRASVGDFVDKGDLLFELIDLTFVKTAFMVPERYISRIRPGQSAEARVAPYPKETFRGVITYIDPTVDEKSRTVLMKMRTPNPGHRLKPGLFANVQIAVGDYPNATVIPEEAVQPQGAEFFAFVVEEGIAKMRQIQIGLRLQGKVQILSGLSPGQQVVVAGLQKIRDGAPVRINETR